jgi:FkbM family methyltransferase
MAEYHAQHRQDQFLNEKIFHNKRNGVFLDIGANDGVSISNTLFFERELDWTGLCVEPIPEVYERLKNNRKCITVHGCISDKTQKDQFLKIEGYPAMLSGLMSKYDPRHINRINHEINVYGGSKTLIDMECYNINELLEKNNISYIDFCSLDIEGGELDVLKTIDFDKITIKAFAIENNYPSNEIKKFMTSKGYELFEVLECDEIYIKK